MPDQSATVLFIPHGGGPLPLLGDPAHAELTKFLASLNKQLDKPEAIVIFSAHWEESKVTITSGSNPELIYDYYGFPDESYEITYPASGATELAREVHKLFQEQSINATLDDKRGFDHGLFVPLKLIFPDADIPCLQISLLNSLDPEKHIAIGSALQPLMERNILFLGSGFAFHNMRAFFEKKDHDEGNIQFQNWLDRLLTDKSITEEERSEQLIHWEQAPHARYCHPREEHLLPLHLCYGLANRSAERIFNAHIINKLSSAYLWKNLNQSHTTG